MGGLELMEMDVGNGKRVPTVEAEFGLAVVGGGANEVNGYVVGCDETGEVEEMVVMTLGGERDHNNNHRMR